MTTPSDPVLQFTTRTISEPRLRIELIPGSSWESNVRSMVPRKTWDVLRFQVYAAANHHCEICGGQGRGRTKVECHEVWAFEEPVQRLERLICLCPACHEVKHFGFACSRGREQYARAHLRLVNGWGLNEVQLHIARSFALWQARSQMEWTVDISALDPLYGLDVAKERAERQASDAKKVP